MRQESISLVNKEKLGGKIIVDDWRHLYYNLKNKGKRRERIFFFFGERILLIRQLSQKKLFTLRTIYHFFQFQIFTLYHNATTTLQHHMHESSNVQKDRWTA